LETHLLIIDCEKAFDNVQRQILLNILKLRLTLDIFQKIIVDDYNKINYDELLKQNFETGRS
jgi:hypothetical protein